jgi:hypothetical protein
MRDDDEEFGHYVPLLRRIIILVAVITAVPVVLWTITAFVRAYVAPVKIPTFHQLAATASINAPASDAAGDTGSSTLAERLVLERQATARATATDARDSAPAPKGPLLADRPEGAPAGAAVPSAPAPSSPAPNPSTPISSAPSVSPPSPPVAAPAPSAPAMASTSDAPAATGSTTSGTPAAAAATPAIAPGAARITDPSMTTTTTASLAAPPTLPWTGTDGSTPVIRVVGNRQADTSDPLPPARPLSGRIPLPRHRPRDLGSVRIADMAPANIPIPRPRPDAAAAASVDTSSAGPIEFLNNLFGAK